MIEILIFVFLVVFILFGLNRFYTIHEISLSPENKKYKYTLLVIQQNGIENTVSFYSNSNRYTVDDLMNHIWDKDSKTYVLKGGGFKKNLCTINNLYYCESVVKRVGEEE